MLSRHHRALLEADRKVAPPLDPRPRLIPAAVASYEDPTRHRARPWGRGSSKTTTEQYELLGVAQEIPRCSVVYMSDTIGRARDVVWDELVEWAEPVGGKPNASRLTITLPNRSRVFVTGADKIKLFNRKRGIKRLALVVLDEAQDWESAVLEYAVTKVFMSRLGDLEKRFGIKGRIVLSGTGAKDAGYWHDVCTNPELGFGVSYVTQWDNPHIADPDGEFRDACKAAKAVCIELKEPIPSPHPGGRPRWVDTEDQMLRREWFAEFNGGGALQVFRPPWTTCPRALLPTRDVNLVVCADFGTVDAAAAACWLYTPHDGRKYLARVTKDTGLSASKQVKFVRQFAEDCRREYQPAFKPYIVGDGGGLGKALILDIQEAEGGWEVDPAEKQDKVPNIRIMAGDLRDGTAVICEDLQDFMDDLKKPEWHPDHVGEKLKGHTPDQVDAAYMGYRKVKELHFLARPVPEKPRTPEAREAAALQAERAAPERRRRREARGLSPRSGREALEAWKR